MDCTDQLAEIILNLSSALNGLDAIGAHLTAAHVDTALHALQEEARALSWEHSLQVDFSELDKMVDSIWN